MAERRDLDGAQALTGKAAIDVAYASHVQLDELA
jgi:hypothetical protein